MNLREGTRRFALLLGVVGCLAGGVASYFQLHDVLDQRMRHNEFERLATSDVVKQERKTIQIPGFGPPEEPFGSSGVTVNNGGIKTIYWTDNYGVESIETEDGQRLCPTQAPGGGQYFLAVLFPILGFFIPWGTIRAIGWVLVGFFTHQNS